MTYMEFTTQDILNDTKHCRFKIHLYKNIVHKFILQFMKDIILENIYLILNNIKQ